MSEKILLYKILILGDSNVGKTSFLIRFCDDTFDEGTLTTVGVDFKKKFIKRNDKKIALHICDTAGQERFRAIAKNHFKNADGIIIMYDISNKRTFQNIKDWIINIKENLDTDKIGLIIVGNKLDLNQNREVDEDMRKYLEEKQKIKVLEASAKENINVNEAFIELVDKMEKLGLGNKNEGKDELKNGSKKNNNNGGCCARR